MLEPRRVAAKAAARRMAALLGEPVGRTVGYAVKLERRVRALCVHCVSRLLCACNTAPPGDCCMLVPPALQVSAATRIEVVTEGILLRRLQRDPGLEVRAACSDAFCTPLHRWMGRHSLLTMAAPHRPPLCMWYALSCVGCGLVGCGRCTA